MSWKSLNIFLRSDYARCSLLFGTNSVKRPPRISLIMLWPCKRAAQCVNYALETDFNYTSRSNRTCSHVWRLMIAATPLFAVSAEYLWHLWAHLKPLNDTFLCPQPNAIAIGARKVLSLPPSASPAHKLRACELRFKWQLESALVEGLRWGSLQHFFFRCECGMRTLPAN